MLVDNSYSRSHICTLIYQRQKRIITYRCLRKFLPMMATDICFTSGIVWWLFDLHSCIWPEVLCTHAPWSVLYKSHEPNYIIIAFGKRKWLNHLLHWFMRYNLEKHQVLKMHLSEIKIRSGLLVLFWDVEVRWFIIQLSSKAH